VITVRVHENAAVAVDATSKEIGVNLVGYHQWPKSVALGRRESDAEEPVVQTAVAPLNFVKESSQASNLRDPGVQPETATQRLDLVQIFGDPATAGFFCGQDSRRSPSSQGHRAISGLQSMPTTSAQR
jgi:hypothetical protein